MGMKEKIAEIHALLSSELAQADSMQALDALRVKILGKKGELTALLRGMGQLSPEERPAAGQLINVAREEMTALLDERQAAIKARDREAALAAETIDVTQPAPQPLLGSEHPLTLALNEVVDCFTGMGFEVVEGPEVELDHFNFELLNIPKNHPARDAQDTFYIDDNIVLRTHTSPCRRARCSPASPPSASSAPAACTARTKWTRPTAPSSTSWRALSLTRT